jgi:hypothetical protein
METELIKFYQGYIEEYQNDINEMYHKLTQAQGLSIERQEDGFKVWDYNDGSKVIYDAESIEQAREFVFNRAISKLLLS